jgi:hypothetical protein
MEGSLYCLCGRTVARVELPLRQFGLCLGRQRMKGCLDCLCDDDTAICNWQAIAHSRWQGKASILQRVFRDLLEFHEADEVVFSHFDAWGRHFFFSEMALYTFFCLCLTMCTMMLDTRCLHSWADYITSSCSITTSGNENLAVIRSLYGRDIRKSEVPVMSYYPTTRGV